MGDQYIIEQAAKHLQLPLQNDLTGLYIIGTFLLSAPNSSDNSMPEWLLSATNITPGRRTLRNGDPGYPDEVDIVDIGSYPELSQALAELARRDFQKFLDDTALIDSLFPEPDQEEETVI